MSHFTTLVLVPGNLKGKAIEKKMAELLEPFNEATEVPEYDRECYCVNNEARDFAHIQADAKFPIDKLRADFQGHVNQVCAKYGFDPNQYSPFGNADSRIDNELDKIWKLMLKPRHDFREATEKAHPRYMKPKAKCEECQGKGTLKSTYNPNSKWDWYSVGGRWSGFLPNKKNHATVKELLESPTKDWTPYALVTPEGRWCQHGEMGWFGMSSDEKDEAEWDTEVIEVLKKYPDAQAVLVDCHI
jgi:hypothetical protein